MKKIIAATALTMFFTAGALAEGVDANERATLDAMNDGDTSIVDIMMDENGKDRDDADFKDRWDKATPEQRTMLKDTCAKGIESRVKMTDHAVAHCKIVEVQ